MAELIRKTQGRTKRPWGQEEQIPYLPVWAVFRWVVLDGKPKCRRSENATPGRVKALPGPTGSESAERPNPPSRRGDVLRPPPTPPDGHSLRATWGQHRATPSGAVGVEPSSMRVQLLGGSLWCERNAAGQARSGSPRANPKRRLHHPASANPSLVRRCLSSPDPWRIVETLWLLGQGEKPSVSPAAYSRQGLSGWSTFPSASLTRSATTCQSACLVEPESPSAAGRPT